MLLISKSFSTNIKIFIYWKIQKQSTYPKLATKPNFQTMQIWFICEDLWTTTTHQYNLCSTRSSFYLMIAHDSLDRRTLLFLCPHNSCPSI
jgi:hypothetical protein